MPLKLTKFKAAAISAAPVYLNREASIDKACSLIAECARNGAKLIAFPEVFVPGYPHWLHVLRVDQGYPLHVRLVKNAVEVPSEATISCATPPEKPMPLLLLESTSGIRSTGEPFTTPTSLSIAPVESWENTGRSCLPW